MLYVDYVLLFSCSGDFHVVKSQQSCGSETWNLWITFFLKCHFKKRNKSIKPKNVFWNYERNLTPIHAVGLQ